MPDFSSAQPLYTEYQMFWKDLHIHTDSLGKKNSRTGTCIKNFCFPLETLWFFFSLDLKYFDSAYEKIHPLYDPND